MPMKHFNSILVILIVMQLVACTNDHTCHEERYVAMGVKLYRTTFDEESETYVQNAFEPDSITVYGLDNDSILYEKVKLSALYLPLRTDKASFCITEYIFSLTDDSYDTITIKHNNIDNYISFACGCIVFADLIETETTTHEIDSVMIVNPSVQNVQDTHINVFYK